jgi:hypothetical protein
MSIKDLFEKQNQNIVSLKGLTKSTIDQFSDTVESSGYVTQKQIYAQTFVPDLDYSSASNFVKFGSAEKYYTNSINRITNQYPYDGSKAEQLEFYNSINPLERYIFDNEYPKSTGYVNFSPNGWGTRVSTSSTGIGLPTNVEYISFYNQSQNNVYDPANGLRENTRFIFSSGSTIEFWMKKDSYADYSSQSAYEVVFYMASTGSDNKDKSFSIILPTTASQQGLIELFYCTAQTTSPQVKFFFLYDTGLATIADSRWHHYAFTLYSSSAGYTSEFYLDGVYKSSQSTANSIVDFTGSAFCTIGALGGKLSSETTSLGSAKLSGSIDEFRFWNTRRDAKQIGTNYFTHVGGGTNTDLANVNLGVYYKFNEGVTLTNSDTVVLDYAGRVCNGSFAGYSVASRSTGSAINSATDSIEPQDPIIRSNNSLVQSYLAEKVLSGSFYDSSNTSNLLNSIPAWILDEDNNGGEVLSNFLQVLASYLDTLYLQISNLNKLKNITYEQNGGKQNPFNNKLLTSLGFDTPDLFINSDILKSLFDQDDKRLFEEKIDDIKNQIYKNIYNNLIYINKSKGTEKSFRNLIRCFGVDDNLFKLTIYADNADYNFKDKYTNLGIKKSYLDMTEVVDSQNAESVVYQYPQSGNSNSSGYITSSTNYNIGTTLEAEIVFPKLEATYNNPTLSVPKTYTSQSLFGIHEAVSESDTTFAVTDRANLQTYAVTRDNLTYFVVSSSLGLYGETPVVKNVFSDSRWNISFRIKPTGYPFVSGAFAAPSYTAEFHGYNYDSGELINSFTSSFTVTTASAQNFYNAAKRVYAGAHRQNITGSLLTQTNIKLQSVRYWADYLDEEEIKIHSRDVRNFGRSDPYQNSFIYENVGSAYIPKIETLSMFWDFETVSTSSGTGVVANIPDIKSASIGDTRYPTSFRNLVGYQHTAQGSYFANSFEVRKADYYNSSRNQIPENINSSDLVQILEADDEKITSQTLPETLFFSVESSMYDAISRKALEFFSTVVDFNNLVGQPVNKYKTSYKELDKLKQLFFEKVENSPDLDKYVNLYKWVDDALESVLGNLIPASANASDKVRTIIESHILERNKIHYNVTPRTGSFNQFTSNTNDEGYGTNVVIPGPPPINDGPKDDPTKWGWSNTYSGIGANTVVDISTPVVSVKIPVNSDSHKLRTLPSQRQYIDAIYVSQPYVNPPNVSMQYSGYNTKAKYLLSRKDSNLVPGVVDTNSAEALRISVTNEPRAESAKVIKFSNSAVDVVKTPGSNGSLSNNNSMLTKTFLNNENASTKIIITLDNKQIFLPDSNIKQQVDLKQEKVG